MTEEISGDPSGDCSLEVAKKFGTDGMLVCSSEMAWEVVHRRWHRRLFIGYGMRGCSSEMAYSTFGAKLV